VGISTSEPVLVFTGHRGHKIKGLTMTNSDFSFDKAMLYTPVAAGVIFGACGWASFGMAIWGVAIITAVHLSFSYRLTKVISRYLEISEAGDRYSMMAGTVKFLGIALCLGDAAIVHAGIHFMLDQSGIHLHWVLTAAASLCLSVYNTTADWGFGSDLIKEEATDASRKAAEDLATARPIFSAYDAELAMDAGARELEMALSA